MIVVTVLYPKTGQSHFDHDYYLQRHVPLVRERWESFGLKEVRLLRGRATLDGASPNFELIGELTFPSVEHIQNALGAHGAEIVADIAKFTNIQPLLQVNDLL